MFNHFLKRAGVKKILTFVLFQSLFFSFFTHADPKLNSEIEELSLKGLNQSYNFKWQEAHGTFNIIINKFPEDPRGYHFQASTYLWYYLSSKNDSDYNEFLKYSDLSIEKATKEIEENSLNKNILYILGSAYTYRAIVFSKAENYLDAAWATKKSESYLNNVLAIDSAYYDAYLGLGLYNFAISQIPSAFKWALRLAGIDGDKAEGIKYIKKCARYGKFSKADAQYYLSQILAEVLFDYDAASVYLKNLIQKYPENLIFNYSYASLEIKRSNLDQSQKILEKIVQNNNPVFNQLISLSNFLLGDIYFKKNEFEFAKDFYLSFLTLTNDNDYTGIAALRLGICYDITGDSSLAAFYYSQSEKGNMDLDDDIYAKRKGEMYSEDSLDSNEVQILKAANKIESGKYRNAFSDLFKLIPVIKDDDLKAEVYLYLSEAAFKMGNIEESLKMAFAAQSINTSEEKWIKPFAVYYIARAYKKMGNIIAFNNFIDEADSYEDFDYQNKLKNLIYSIKSN